MKFKPVTKKYVFDENVLTKSYPDYLKRPLIQWVGDVLREAQIWNKIGIYGGTEIDNDFLNNLNIHFRENFPKEFGKFLNFIFEDDDRVTNIIALCLQNYARRISASKLERILAIGGSGYSVIFIVDNPQEYQKGVADLTDRVSEVVQQSADEIMKIQPLIKRAWISCYSRNPDYAKTVDKCVDALEGLFKDNYFPDDGKPSLGKFVKSLRETPALLNFKGDNLLEQKNQITDLASKFLPIRGHHTSGTGREPTKEEAEFVLHYTIFVFSIHC